MQERWAWLDHGGYIMGPNTKYEFHSLSVISAGSFIYNRQTASPVEGVCSISMEESLSCSTWWEFALWKELRWMTIKSGDTQALAGLLLRINPPKGVGVSFQTLFGFG